jgi:hypothetical protein
MGGIYISMVEWILYGTQEAITITPDGYVGLGVSDPKNALEVAGGTVLYGPMTMSNAGASRNNYINVVGTQAGLVLNSTNSSNGHSYNMWSTQAGNSAGAGTLSIYDETAAAYRMVIGSNGNVGFGTTAPARRYRRCEADWHNHGRGRHVPHGEQQQLADRPRRTVHLYAVLDGRRPGPGVHPIDQPRNTGRIPSAPGFEFYLRQILKSSRANHHLNGGCLIRSLDVRDALGDTLDARCAQSASSPKASAKRQR